MKKLFLVTCILLVAAITTNAQQGDFPKLTGPYLGQQPPGKELKRFAPGIISPHHSSISVSPDGKEIYWATYSSIMMTQLINGLWTKPVEVSFSAKSNIRFYDDVPFVSPDNRKLFFLSKRPRDSRAENKINMFYVERVPGGWSEPKPVDPEINKMRLHWQISVSNSGTLYFAGSEGKQPPDNIWYSKFIDGKYSKPINIGPIINKGSCSCPFIAPDESYIIFTREVDSRPIPYISFKSKNGQWMEPINLEKYIGKSNCMIVSPDKKYLFILGGLWIDASFIEELRPKE
jgi:hypothetical protein